MNILQPLQPPTSPLLPPHPPPNDWLHTVRIKKHIIFSESVNEGGVAAPRGLE